MKNKMSSKKVHIGTSGWSYPHWKENFFPKELKSTDWLHYYAGYFSTVEINTTFYHLPRETTVKNWYAQVPDDFRFSIKASRYITHRKLLKDCKNSLELFYKVIKDFKEKTGPILFQLPPYFRYSKERLVEFCALLDHDHQYVFEFRHDTWYVDEVYDILSKNKIALCITDLNGHLTPEEFTSNFTYIRLHGPKKAYEGSYGPKGISMWKNKIEKWALDKSVYCYFDNDEKGFAVQDADTMQHFF